MNNLNEIFDSMTPEQLKAEIRTSMDFWDVLDQYAEMCELWKGFQESEQGKLIPGIKYIMLVAISLVKNTWVVSVFYNDYKNGLIDKEFINKQVKDYFGGDTSVLFEYRTGEIDPSADLTLRSPFLK